MTRLSAQPCMRDDIVRHFPRCGQGCRQFANQKFMQALDEFDKAIAALAKAASHLHAAVTRPAAAHGRVLAELAHATAANPRMRRQLLAAQQPDQRSATVCRRTFGRREYL